ncbi:uncharacterized protein [Drosophila tropicalis]|uniref:uncharacterized protein n=1 Tax=Drosophila tropicalis TaxID=46794 RepID=UPI0035ABE031
MGRLFQYNRFGATDNVNKRKKDTPNKNKMLRQAIKCPDYADIYGEYQKKQPLMEKLEFPTLSVATTTPAGTTTTTAEAQLSRTHKVYDSMKNFLQRKLFATSTQKDDSRHQHHAEEPTSDYDEQDLLDSSYQADLEEDDQEDHDADCSCSSSSSTSASTSSSSEQTSPKRSPQKSLLSLNCWQSSQPSDSSETSSREEDDEGNQDDTDAGISDCCQLLNDANLSKRRPTPTKKRSKIRYNHNNTDDEDDEEPELLECSWYQPRISSKAAQEHLISAKPGSFLLRRSTPRNFELCLRLDRKVKNFAIQNTRNQMFCLKGAKKQFTTLKALITHHSVMAEQLPMILDMPRERHIVKSSAIRYADDFEPLESLQLLGILKSLQAKNFEI